MDVRLPRIEPGGILTAEHVNAPNEALERLTIRVGSNSSIGKNEGTGGTSLYAITPPEFWAKITSGGGGSGGSSGPYAWTRQIEDVGGAWIDGYESGTTTVNPAYESNGNASVAAGKRVWLRFSETARIWSFVFSACS